MLPTISQHSFSAIRKAVDCCRSDDRHLFRIKGFLKSYLIPIHGSCVAEANKVVKTPRLVNDLRLNQNALFPSKALFLKNHNR